MDSFFIYFKLWSYSLYYNCLKLCFCIFCDACFSFLRLLKVKTKFKLKVQYIVWFESNLRLWKPLMQNSKQHVDFWKICFKVCAVNLPKPLCHYEKVQIQKRMQCKITYILQIYGMRDIALKIFKIKIKNNTSN